MARMNLKQEKIKGVQKTSLSNLLPRLRKPANL
jgi:hypothetical protein